MRIQPTTTRKVSNEKTVTRQQQKKLKRNKHRVVKKAPVRCELELENQIMNICSLGESETLHIGSTKQLVHGTSVDLMNRCCKQLQRDFEVNAKEDFERYISKNKYTYYIAVQSKKLTVDCALRVVIDDLENPSVLLVDFIRTRPACKGQGLATQLIHFLLRGCQLTNCSVYITSTPEAESYWSRFGFVTEVSEDVSYIMNEFGDCTLLTLPSNPPFVIPDDYSGDEYDDEETESSEETSSDEYDSDSSNDCTSEFGYDWEFTDEESW